MRGRPPPFHLAPPPRRAGPSCRACGNVVARSAWRCPSCGSEVATAAMIIPKVLIVILVVGFLVVAFS